MLKWVMYSEDFPLTIQAEIKRINRPKHTLPSYQNIKCIFCVNLCEFKKNYRGFFYKKNYLTHLDKI